MMNQEVKTKEKKCSYCRGTIGQKSRIVFKWAQITQGLILLQAAAECQVGAAGWAREGGVEEGRAANLIQLFGGAVTVKLSSAAVPDKESDDTILIRAPILP